MTHTEKMTIEEQIIQQLKEKILEPVRGFGLTRAVLVIVLSIITLVMVNFYFQDLGKNIANSRKGIEWDWGGLSTLSSTIIVLLCLKVDRSIRKVLTEKYQDYFAVIIAFLALTGIFGIWLSIRTIGLYLLHYVIGNFRFSISDLFSILSFILTTNLCFSLSRTFREMGQKTTAGQQPKDNSALEQQRQIIPNLIDAGLQAVIIGLITFAPRYGDSAFFNRVGRSMGYFTILIGIVLALFVLVLAKHLLMRGRDEKAGTATSSPAE